MLFPLGKLVATPGVLDNIPTPYIYEAIQRHQSGDWGDLCREDREQNDRALERGERLLSSYRTPFGVKFWIITEADRSVTTVLLPDEY